jgi:hypothetical protein
MKKCMKLQNKMMEAAVLPRNPAEKNTYKPISGSTI